MTAENSQAQSISLIGATVVVPSGCDETVSYAAAELSRFLYRLGGRVCQVTNALPEVGSAVVLSTDKPSGMEVAASVRPFGDQSFHLAAFSKAESCGVAVSAGTAAGVLYGIYRLLEELGMGFYAGGETYPDLPVSLSVSVDFEVREQPAFAIRGNMLHYNFLCGPTNWGLADYKFYFDQLARMRCNMLIMHWYDVEPGAAYHQEGEYRTGGVTPNSLTKPWGALTALRTSEFSFGSGRFYDADVFTSPMAADAPDLLSEIRESERVWCEAPRGDPTDPVVMAGFRERMRQFLGRNPHLTHFALWQHESGACFGTTPPSSDTDAAAMLESRRQVFAHLGSDLLGGS